VFCSGGKPLRRLLVLVFLIFPLTCWADTVVVDGVLYPRDPFLTHEEQVKIFEEIKKEWIEFQNKFAPKSDNVAPEAKIEEVPNVVEPSNPPKYPDIRVDAILSSIDINGRVKRWVLIEGRLLQEGDHLGKVIIDKIENDRIIVSWMGERREVKVGNDKGKIPKNIDRKEKERRSDNEET
jgi:hypothetical protein